MERASVGGALNTFLDSITDGVVICDREWCLIFVNQGGAKILDKTQQDLMGRELWEVCWQAIGSTFYQECHRAVAEQVPVCLQEFCDRLETWLEIHLYPSTEGLIVLFQDISQRKQKEITLQQICDELEHQVLRQTVKLTQTSATLVHQMSERLRLEAALRNSNTQQTKILECINEGFFTLDRQWRFNYVNHKAEQILQQHPGELLGRNIWQVYPQTFGSRFCRQCHAAARMESSVQFEEFSSQLNRWIEYNIFPSPSGISVYFQDITRHKQIEAECQQLVMREQKARVRAELAEQRFAFLSQVSQQLANSLDYQTTLSTMVRSVIPFLADYCLIQKLEADGTFRHAAAMHYDSQKQALVDELSSRYQSDLQNSDSLIGQVLRTQEPVLIAEFSDNAIASMTQDSRVLEIYQELAPKSFIIVPIAARGQIFGTLLLATAESDRYYTQSDLSLAIDLASRAAMAIDNAQLYQQAQESNRLKDEFLASLPHELRTPLHLIWGWAQMLVRQAPDDGLFSKGMKAIESQAKELVKVVYDLLDVSRIVTGRLCLNAVPVDLVEVIQDAIASLTLAAEAKSIQIEANFDLSVKSVRGDSERLRQVVWQLLSNAIKFTPHGGRVEIQIERVEQESEKAEENSFQCPMPNAQIKISDTGKGIASSFLPYIFDRFRQADGSISRCHGGLGLGLSLVRYLVEMHGGTIEVFSPGEDQGTTAIVKLPISTS